MTLTCCSGLEYSWIGLHQDGGLQWLDGTEVDFVHWYAGDPDYPSRRREIFVIHYKRKMKDRQTMLKYSSFCQMGTGGFSLVPDLPGRCQVPFVPSGDRCIYVNASLVSQPVASAACHAMCADCTLASIHSQDELTAMEAIRHTV